MSESDKKNNAQVKNPSTAEISPVPANIELTQKVEIDYEKIIDKDKREEMLSKIRKEQRKTNVSASIAGKSIFSKKRVTDDYIKTDSIVYSINSISPLGDEVELQDINYNYELKDKFAEGAQGIINTALDKSLKRHVVVKSLKGDKSEKHAKKSEDLFVSEARIMAQLEHPSIVPLYGLHSGDKSKLHLAMKHIHGKTLRQYLLDVIELYKNEGIENFDEKRSIATRIEYLIKVCEAIYYAHSKGVIHRDVKSENIMIGNHGEVYVMDWGLACLINPEKLPDDDNSKKKKGSGKRAIVGTPCYMAPELIVGGKCSQQSDIFALGMVLFEVITLQRAASGDSVNEVFKNVINRDYCPFKHRFLKEKLPNDLKAIFEKAVSPIISDRYTTANDMANDLRLFLMREETAARPDNIFRKFIRSMINHKLITLTVMLSLLLAFAGVTIHSLYNQNILVRQQKVRENMLATFQYNVSKKANDVDGIFAYFKSQLANLAFTAGGLLSKPVTMSPPIFNMKYYKQTSTAPLDYVYSPAYDRKISLNFTAFKLGADVKPGNYIIRRIAAIWVNLAQVLFRSDRTLKGMTTKQIIERIINKGVTLSWVYVGLENGSMICYPGGNINVKGFDPRKLKWYQNATRAKHSLVWSEPYINVFSSKLVITCSRCIYSNPQKLQGVAGMDISLDYIQQQMFTSNKNSGLKEYLLTKDGRVIISSDFDNKKVQAENNTTLILKRFPFNEDFQEALKDKLVLFEAERNNKKYIFVFNKLPSVDYYYLQQVSERKLSQDWQKRITYKNK